MREDERVYDGTVELRERLMGPSKERWNEWCVISVLVVMMGVMCTCVVREVWLW